jgi:hypothetical protein
MPVWLKFRLRRILIRRSGPEAGVWASTIVMNFARFERLSDVCLVEGNGEIQTLATCGPDQSFAKRVGLGRFVGCLQNNQPQCFQGRVQLFRVNAVTIMNHKPVSFIAGNTFPELL